MCYPHFFSLLLSTLLMKNAEGGHGFVTHPRRSRRDPAKILNDLDFADDIALLSGSKKDTQQQVKSHIEAAKEVGLLINIGKTRGYDTSLLQRWSNAGW